ncbi:MAG: tRNA (adenosine(37)-N6)-threonylcarbamoyltransferase complex ATPase subunit type 1 TsaE [Chloroflexi bacterium RBG_13_50_10]|nr:MAG: tRNA (adenosine(37)-N6)-threonylcarbamoyltransferase complex ATPase subunit type 1 TsaE [Chloroflexi bacterium RBG_13_50_10]
MTDLKFISRSPEQTQRLGMRLGELAEAGDVFLLTGNLGSGKTCLTQGIAWGLDIKEYAFSPSFVIVREYHGRLPLYHIDFYRLDRIEEITDLGLEEYIYGKGVCVVEWAEKGIAVLPEEHLLINLGYVSDTERSISIEPKGHRYTQLMKSLNTDLKAWN